MMVTALTKRQWQSLMKVTNIGDDIARLEQETGLDLNQEGSRYECRAQIVDALNKWSIAKNLNEIATLFDGAGICWGLYQSFKQMVGEDARASLKNPLFQRDYPKTCRQD